MRLHISAELIIALGCSCAGAFLAPPGVVVRPRAAAPAYRPARPRHGVLNPCPRSSRAGLRVHIGDEQAASEVGSQGSSYKHPNFDEPFELEARPAAYDEVLAMLQELDRNGTWPNTSRRRSELLKNTSRRESIGDSFTIGLFPPPLRMPHANDQLPGLLDALLRLEGAICPNRPCSTTITVNRHAQFRPHRDSGAGAGQSTSLIVGLGDYIGGSLMVEGQVHDIRYKPLEFDGWRELHWTRPFRGERYSLVWYTPQGLEEPRETLERGEGWRLATAIALSLPPVSIVSATLAKIEAAKAFRTPTERGPITTQIFSMSPPNVNFKSKISLLAIERLDMVRATNLQVPLRSTSKGAHEGFQGRVLFDSDAPANDFLNLQLCESVRVVLMHQDFELAIGATPSVQDICQWIIDTADWDLGLDTFRRFGNAGPASRDFTGFHVRCKTSAGRLHEGASQDIRIALALAVYEKFGWQPVIKRGDAAIEILVTFHKSGVMVEMPLLVQKEIKWENHAASELQLSYLENARKGNLPPIEPKFPPRDTTQK